jgi:uncharacterized membrane protein YccC
LYTSLYEQRRELLNRLYALPAALPAPDRKTAAIYALRLVLTVSLASEVYRRLGIQSGYWIPMTALLVQKPAFYETLSRALARVAGTLAGATLATVLAAHLHPGVWPLAALTTFFAFWCFATNGVNYGLFSLLYCVPAVAEPDPRARAGASQSGVHRSGSGDRSADPSGRATPPR